MGLSDSNTTNARDESVCVIAGETSGLRADVNLISGINRLETSSLVTIEQIFGKYPFADSWFRIENTGAQNNTWTITISATVNDPSTPDRDVVLYTKVFTVLLAEVGDEIALRDRMVSELNSDVDFKANFKARKVKDNAVVHIESKFRGEFYSRTAANSFNVVVTGSASVTLGFNDFIPRNKPNELAINEDDPRVGVLGISGSLQIQPGSIADRFEIKVLNGANSNMNVNGSGTPVTFTFPAITGFDQFITEITIQGLDNGVKLANFLGINTALTNGLTFSVKADNQTFSFPTVKSTREIKRFASTGGWYLDIESAGDDVMAIKELGLTPIPIRAIGSFGTDDFFSVTVNDNLTGVIDLSVIVKGFKKEI